MRLEEVTACGECCTDCTKKKQGLCQGCIESDGHCREWVQSGRCPIHACARAHGVQFCGMCKEFPCAKLPEMIRWNPAIVQHLRSVARKVLPTLYLSDLDGTLLRSDQSTSDYTNRTINALVEKGMLFSYATARSRHTAAKATQGLKAAIPLILYNGAFIMDNATGKVLLSNFFSDEESREILSALLEAGVQPIVYAFVQGKERMMYRRDKLHPQARAFMDTRRGDVRDTPVEDENTLAEGETFYFTCIDEEEKLAPLHQRFQDQFRCVYSKDIYAETMWLEIMPKAATKANAARQLAHMLGCRRIVAFGDHVNDLDLFTLADECYAVANAVPELKAAATAVIAANDEDGVARWLAENVEM